MRPTLPARILAPALLAALTALPALAQTAAPAAAPAPATGTTEETTAGPRLSEILAGIEGEAGFVRFDTVEWDRRAKRWNIAYSGANGRKVSVVIDAVSGQPVIE